MFKSINLFLIMIAALLLSCNETSNEALLIDFSSDSSSIVISNINSDGLLQLKNNLKTDTMYQKLVSVLQTPAEDDSISMEIEWPGKLTMQGDNLVFSPDSSFKKGKQYLVETMINTKFATGEEILKSEVGHNVKPVQKMLKKD
jgi:hypothetical protein